MASHSRVESKGKGVAGLKALVSQLEKKPEVRIGVFAAKDLRLGDGPTNVEIAAINEFGGGDTPERSFLRRTADAKNAAWGVLLEKILKKGVASKLDIHSGLEALGMRAAADVRATITRGSGVPPPNAPSTIARKGSSRPLIDSTQMLNSITHVVKVG